MSNLRQLQILALAGGAAALLILAFLGLSALLRPDAPPPSENLPDTLRLTAEQLSALQFERVGPQSLGGLTAATGMIDADGDLSTPIFLPYSGQVSRVLVDTGEKVTRGQPLLTVRTSDFVDARAAFYNADAGYRAAQAQLVNAQRNAERQRLLAQTAGGAEKDYQQAQTDLATAQAQARSTAAAVAGARDKLAILGGSASRSPGAAGREDVTLHAPIGGTIAARDVSPGQYVTAGGDHPLLTITDPSRVWLIAQLAESEAGSVHVGDTAEVTTPAYPGRVFHAVIDTVGAALDPTTHRLPVRAKIVNPDGALKPQMFASFSIRRTGIAAGDRIFVPATAVIHEGDSARVWVQRPDGLLMARAVKTGDEQDGQVEITSGLKSGERIVTAGALFINEAGLGQ